MVNDDQEARWHQERAESWARFRAAVEAAIKGDQQPARAMVKACPEVEAELRNFIRAVREGRLVADPASGTGFSRAKPA